jgi:hypothetical protein
LLDCTQEDVANVVTAAAQASDIGSLGMAGGRWMVEPYAVPFDNPLIKRIHRLMQLAERGSVSVSGRGTSIAAFRLDHPGTWRPYVSVYASEADAAASAKHWKDAISHVVMAQPGHLDPHPHGPGGVHATPGGAGHSGYQVDVTRKLHLLTIGIRIAVDNTPFGWVPPGEELHVLALPPGAIWIMSREAVGELALMATDRTKIPPSTSAECITQSRL